MIPGLMMYPGGVGGRRSVASRLAAYPNLAAYFEAGLGETTDPGPPVKVSRLVSPIYVAPAAVARTVVAPSDLTNAAWTKSGTDTLSASLLQAQAITGYHFARQNIADVVVGARSKVSVEFWAGTWDYIWVQFGGSTALVKATISTQTITSVGSSVSGAAITPLGGGHYRLDYEVSNPVNNQLFVGLASSGGATSWAAAGTENANFANILVEQYPPASPREYIQTIDQSTFANMPLRDTTGWGSGKEAIKGDGAAYYMSGVMGAAMAPPFGLLSAANNTSSGTVRQLICGTTASVGAYLTTTDYLSYYDGSAASVISDAPIAAGKHIILVLVTATTVQAWIDGVAQTAVSVSSANLGAAFNVMANAAGAGSFFDSDIRSLGLYLGNWTTDGTRAGLESFLNSRAGGGLI